MNQTPYENPYKTNDFSYPTVAERANSDVRAAFIQRTYLHLLGAILAFAALDAIILTVFHDQLNVLVPKLLGGWTWLIVLGAFMFVSYIADRWANSNTSRQMQYLGLCLYVIAEALIFIPLLFIAQNFAKDPNLLLHAGIVTGVVFGGLTLTVLVTKADFSFLKWALVAGGFIAMGLIVGGIAFGFSLGLWFSVAMVVLASGAILYNTSNILHRYNTDQHVAASLALFASVALLFWYVIQIFMHMEE
jgi:FtsH-binding integral membrane protein